MYQSISQSINKTIIRFYSCLSNGVTTRCTRKTEANKSKRYDSEKNN